VTLSSVVADIFRRAAEQNRDDDRRSGNLLTVTGEADVIVAGDIHGHRKNLSKIISYANLGSNADRRLVLQELIHGPPDAATGHDRSVELLLRAARLKAQRPEQVLMLLGNHDVAQVTGNEITKAGRGVCEAFTEGARFAFGADADDVLEAIDDFLLSLPLAIQCSGGTLISHSLPSPGRMEAAGTDILRCPHRREDLRRGGPVYEWTWGRGHTPEQLDDLAAELGVEFFVLGHQHIHTGWRCIAPRAITIASDHEHGCVMRFSAETLLTEEAAVACTKPIVALGART
jgi:3',5'-cyclic AMP phosphodiesterase CpdA